MRRSLYIIAAIVSLSGAAFAQAAPNSVASSASGREATNFAHPNPELQGRTQRYQLRPGDSFDIEFAFAPEFNQSLSVQPDGFITLRSVGSIIAAELTIPELTKAIQQAYSSILHQPVITVNLKDFDRPYFLVAGQVSKPGKYDLRSDLTVTEGVAIAGGFTEASKHSQVVLFRPGANGLSEARLIDVKKMLRSRNLTEDVPLRPGDMIFVPQNRISKIQRYLPTTNLAMYGYPGSL